MANKTATLKNQVGDNIYPNIVGDNRNAAIKDSTTIKHTLVDNKISLDLDEAVKGKINAALQKPAGLTKTKLVGVGTNGQENIEIGDNLTLANGKLSATGGSSGGDFDVLTLSDDATTYTGTITGTKPVLAKNSNGSVICTAFSNNLAESYSIYLDEVSILSVQRYTNGKLTNTFVYFQKQIYSHFITMENSSSNVALYLTIQNTSEVEFTADTLASYLADMKVLANGNLHGVVPTYIAGIGGSIYVYYMTPGDNNINPDPDVFGDLSSFTISDKVNPVK